MNEYTELLTNLIRTPSVSREETNAAALIRSFLDNRNIKYQIHKHNTWSVNRYFEEGKPTILLNSHIDTVKPVAGWTYDPFWPAIEGDRLTGLGSNDAGGPLVSLLAAFMHFHDQKDMPFNLLFAASAEEENSGADGFESIIPLLPAIDFAVVGEPTRMELAIAEKGLLVLDCTATGKSGHAAREEGDNALYKALDDINLLRNFRFEKSSDVLGPVKITVTQIEAGSQHNVVPGECRFVVDVRTNEHYSNRQVFETISGLISSSVAARSFRLNSSGIPAEHPFARRAGELGIPSYGSPTTSDQAIMPWPSVKIGPGDSARSHTANEFILLSEIEDGIHTYIKLLADLRL